MLGVLPMMHTLVSHTKQYRDAVPAPTTDKEAGLVQVIGRLYLQQVVEEGLHATVQPVVTSFAVRALDV